MNENIDLTKILRDCPEGFELYSSIHGEVKFINIHENPVYSWINIITEDNIVFNYTSEGKYYPNKGECTLFPSKDQRDWSKFSAPWYKNKRFDPKTLQPFDKVLVTNGINSNIWKCGLFSHVEDGAALYKYSCVGDAYVTCIPYNEDTKHLVGTTEKAPEYYKYWED